MCRFWYRPGAFQPIVAHDSLDNLARTAALNFSDIGAAIAARLDTLAAISDSADGLTRLYLSPAHKRAANLVADWMRDAGMRVELDAIGNIVGRYNGAAAGAPALLLASHIDTVRNAGRFDGNLGVVTAIEIVRQLHALGRRLPFAIEVVAFGDEEGVRFPSSLGGSRALAGTANPAILEETDTEGVTRRAALKGFGCPELPLESLARQPEKYIGYVEVHIEQGPVLEARGLPLGIVSAINGASRGLVVVTGRAGHAGTVPMDLRADALTAAAAMALAIEARARAEPDLVATVGQLTVTGGAVNTVPGRVEFTLDCRAPDDRSRKAALADIRAAIAAIADERRVTACLTVAYDAPAAPCDPGVSQALAQAAARCGYAAPSLPSGAGHDAMAFKDVLPFAMLFVRCKGGVSHNPAEFASIADMSAAAHVLADFVEHLKL